MLIYSTNINTQEFSQHLKRIINKDSIFVCLGTDKIIFDSLGPYVGHLLKKRIPYLKIYGTLENPITSKNINYLNLNNTNIIAIDSFITNDSNHLNYISLYDEPVIPAGGSLSPIGSYKIVGNVDINSNPNIYRNNVKLFNIVTMAELISESIFKSLEE